MEYLLEAGIATLKQLFVLLGPLILLAFLMNIIALENVRLSYKIMGEKIYLYVFGWLGIAVHELGHALFAVLFAHKIEKIKLFTPNSGKSLGHVEHRYNSKNLYQTIGNFFIGIGPILIGAVLLFLVSWFFFKMNVFKIAEKSGVIILPDILLSFDKLKSTFMHTENGLWECIRWIFNSPESSWWKILLFFYFFYSVGSSARLSSSDIKGAFKGFLYFLVLLLIFNIATWWMGDFAFDFLNKISMWFSGFYFLILLAIGLNVVFLILLFFINFLKSVFF